MALVCPECGAEVNESEVEPGKTFACACGAMLAIEEEADEEKETGAAGARTLSRVDADAGQSGPENHGAATAAPADDPTQLVTQLQSNIDRKVCTISEFLAGMGVAQRAGVQLEDSDSRDTSGSAVLASEQGRKYQVGKMVAKGGMGAILSVRDLNIRRRIAMKVMLDPATVSTSQVLRFVEEAQVTGQLEHPSIVPVYELGVDAVGNAFYTMKMVKGVTLKQVLEEIAQGKYSTVKKYPLLQLLNIFQKSCDAMAFAHAKGVIHRDLKPENIMVGEFGEVLVMDWGLAKVLGGASASDPSDRPDPSDRSDPSAPVIDSVRSDGSSGEVLKTLDGQVMGTPQFMAPEQALGQIDALDARTDIYALGGILYNILTLHPPIEGKNLRQILLKVSKGDITPPSDTRRAALLSDKSDKSDKSDRSDSSNRKGTGGTIELPHCPNGRIPPALSAVAMKALAREQAERYQSVRELQADIEAFQGGFATSAEQAGLGRQFVLRVRRHKTAVAAAALVFLAVTVGLVVSLTQWRKAVRNERLAESARAVAEEQRAKTAAAIEKSEYENYRNVIALADRKIEDGEIVHAEQMLWDTPRKLRGWEWGRCMFRCHGEVLPLKEHTRGVYAVAFSPDGKRLVSGGMSSGATDNPIRLWDLETGKTAVLPETRQHTYAVAFSPEGRSPYKRPGHFS